MPAGYKQRKNPERAQRGQAKRTHLALHSLFICLPAGLCVCVSLCVLACLIIMLNTLLVIVLRRREGGGADAHDLHTRQPNANNKRAPQSRLSVLSVDSFTLLSGQLLKHSCSCQHLLHAVIWTLHPSVSQSVSHSVSPLVSLLESRSELLSSKSWPDQNSWSRSYLPAARSALTNFYLHTYLGTDLYLILLEFCDSG